MNDSNPQTPTRPPLPIDVAMLPKDLTSDQTHNKTIVVFDVLRATTTMTAALAAGVREIRIFADIHSAAQAAAHFAAPRILAGEVDCLPPPGFDLGNSPSAFTQELHADRTIFLSTTNGTKAVIAARTAAEILIGALVNASAVARRISQIGRSATLLCAGTRGQPALEDLLGAGAVIDALTNTGAAIPATDTARIALRLFRASKSSLRETIADATGGQHVLAAGLSADIAFCAAFDSIPIVGRVLENPLRVIA